MAKLKYGYLCSSALLVLEHPLAAKAQFTSGGQTASTVAAAQQAPNTHVDAPAIITSPADSQDIIVTANKRSERALEVPGATTAFRGDDLLRNGTNSIEDLVGLTPGLQFNNGVGTGAPIIRGLSIGIDTSPTVATVVNGAPIGSSSNLSFGAQETLDLDPIDIDRVEVLMGPQGTVYNAARGPIEQDAVGRDARAQSGLPTMPNITQAGGRGSRFWEGDVEGHLRMLMTNLGGPFLMARACITGMVGRGFGRIVNISTSRPIMIRLAQGPYGPLKAALEVSSRIWSAEFDGTGVTVNVLLPGGAADTASIPGGSVGHRAARFVAGEGPRGQEGMATGLLPPAIMAPPLLWLASDESDGVTPRRFVARDWSDALSLAEAAVLAEANHIAEWMKRAGLGEPYAEADRTVLDVVEPRLAEHLINAATRLCATTFSGRPSRPRPQS